MRIDEGERVGEEGEGADRGRVGEGERKEGLSRSRRGRISEGDDADETRFQPAFQPQAAFEIFKQVVKGEELHSVE